MPLTRMIARPMLASMFVYGGLDSIRNPEGKADAAEPVSEMLGHPMENADLVRLNGAIQVGAGTRLAVGKFPRLSAAALAASLVPTTYAGHRFWEADDEHRKAQTIQFFKNVSMLGGLVLAALDTEGRPSVAWRTKHAMAAAPATLAMQAERRSARAR